MHSPYNSPLASLRAVRTASSEERSSLVSRNLTIADHRTSVRLEPDMWNGLREICRRENLSLHEISTAVAMRKPPNSSLTAAIRVFVMAYFRAAATEDGHSKAGHGPGGSFMTIWGQQPQPSSHHQAANQISSAEKFSMESSLRQRL